MADPSDITSGFKDALQAVWSTTTVYDYVPSNVVTPCFVTQFPTEVEYDFSMGTSETRWSFPLQVIVGKWEDRTAWTRIATYLAAESGVKAVLENDVTLDGMSESLRVTEAEVVVYTIAGIDYLAAIFTVDVVA